MGSVNLQALDAGVGVGMVVGWRGGLDPENKLIWGKRHNIVTP